MASATGLFASAWEVFPLIVPIMIFTIPIVAILLKHQQKMAEIIHQNNSNAIDDGNLQRIHQELSGIKDQLNSLTLRVDQIATEQRPVSQRLNDLS